MTRHYARAWKSQRAVDKTPLNTPCNTTVLSSIRLNGDCAYTVYQEGTTAERFAEYLKTKLLPTLSEADIIVIVYMCFFFASHTVGEALKSAVYISALYESFGYDVTPRYNEIRHDIVQSLGLENAESLVAFCQGIQSGSPIDSYLLPEPWDMPGYDSQVIMAAGAFIQGSSIELSADGPMKPPYAVYFQGGLTWYHAKFGIMMSMQKMYEKGLLKIN